MKNYFFIFALISLATLNHLQGMAQSNYPTFEQQTNDATKNFYVLNPFQLKFKCYNPKHVLNVSFRAAKSGRDFLEQIVFEHHEFERNQEFKRHSEEMLLQMLTAQSKSRTIQTLLKKQSEVDKEFAQLAQEMRQLQLELNKAKSALKT